MPAIGLSLELPVSGGGGAVGAVPGDAWLTEDGLSAWQTEDGLSFWLTET